MGLFLLGVVLVLSGSRLFLYYPFGLLVVLLRALAHVEGGEGDMREGVNNGVNPGIRRHLVRTSKQVKWSGWVVGMGIGR